MSVKKPKRRRKPLPDQSKPKKPFDHPVVLEEFPIHKYLPKSPKLK